MLSASHPNALVLSSIYAAMAEVLNDPSIAPDARHAAFTSIAEELQQLLAPDFLIHTGGDRLATTGDRHFMMRMGKRRNLLSGGTFRPTRSPLIIADETYAFVRGTFAAQSNTMRFEEELAGAWRFNAEGKATEHWELGKSIDFDEFFIGCDPDFSFSSAREFWLKDD